MMPSHHTAGWRDLLTQIQQYLTLHNKPKLRGFISFAWEKEPAKNAVLQAWLKTLQEDLERSAFAQVFLDIKNMTGNLQDTMRDGLKNSNVIFFICNPRFVARLKEADKERGLGFEVQEVVAAAKVRDSKLMVLPILQAGTVETSIPAELQQFVSQNGYIDFREPDDYQKRLTGFITEPTDKALIPKIYKITESDEEYQSILQRYYVSNTPSQELILFGREDKLEELDSGFNTQSVSVLFGNSEVGKSSLAIEYANRVSGSYSFVRYLKIAKAHDWVDALEAFAHDLGINKEELGSTLLKLPSWLVMVDSNDVPIPWEEVFNQDALGKKQNLLLVKSSDAAADDAINLPPLSADIALEIVRHYLITHDQQEQQLVERYDGSIKELIKAIRYIKCSPWLDLRDFLQYELTPSEPRVRRSAAIKDDAEIKLQPVPSKKWDVLKKNIQELLAKSSKAIKVGILVEIADGELLEKLRGDLKDCGIEVQVEHDAQEFTDIKSLILINTPSFKDSCTAQEKIIKEVAAREVALLPLVVDGGFAAALPEFLYKDYLARPLELAQEAAYQKMLMGLVSPLGVVPAICGFKSGDKEYEHHWYNYWLSNLPDIGRFVGRGEFLEKIYAALHQETKPTIVAITGMGGFGKTTVAIKYGEQHQANYDLVRVIASEGPALVNSLFSFAKDFGIDINGKKLSDILPLLSNELTSIPRYLLIFDNVETFATIKEYLPVLQNEEQHIIITSRDNNSEDWPQQVELDKFTPAEAAEYLWEELQEVSDELSSALDFLPLALHTAAAFIKEKRQQSHYNIAEYLSETQRMTASDDNPVIKSLKLSLPKIASESDDALRFLRCCAFLAPEHIMPTWFTNTTLWQLHIKSAEVSELHVDGTSVESMRHDDKKHEMQRVCDGLTILTNYSMLGVKNKELTIHRLMQAAVYTSMGSSSEELFNEYLLPLQAVLIEIYPVEKSSVDDYELARKLLPHILKLRSHLQKLMGLSTNMQQDNDLAQALLLDIAADAYHELGSYEQQQQLLQEALAIKDKHYGSEHKEYSKTLVNLAIAYGALGDYVKKRELLIQALLINEKCCGNGSIQYAITLVNLANTHGDLGEYQQKRELLHQALFIKRAYYGVEHVEYAKTLYNLAEVLGKLGKYQQHLRLGREVAKIFKAHYGSEHLQYARALTNLGDAYGFVGQYKKQLGVLQKALAICQKHYGCRHVQYAEVTYELAITYGSLGDYAKKQQLLEEALTIKEQHYGAAHIECALILYELANAYGSQGNHAQKIQILEGVLTRYKEHYGAEHDTVGTCLRSLGSAYLEETDYEKGKLFLEQALSIKKKIYGEEHIEYANTLRAIAKLHIKSGLIFVDGIGEVQDSLKVVLRVQARVYGDKHVQYAKTIAVLAETKFTVDHDDHNNLDQSIQLLNGVVKIYQNFYGATHQHTKRILDILLTLLIKQTEAQCASFRAPLRDGEARALAMDECAPCIAECIIEEDIEQGVEEGNPLAVVVSEQQARLDEIRMLEQEPAPQAYDQISLDEIRTIIDSIETLESNQVKRVLSLLLSISNHNDLEINNDIKEALHKISIAPEQMEQIFPILLAATKNNYWNMRNNAIVVLSKAPLNVDQTEQVLQILVTAAVQDKDWEVRNSATIGLSTLHLVTAAQIEQVVATLLTASKSEDWDVRISAIRGLAKLPLTTDQVEQYLLVLLDAIQDKEQNIKHHVLMQSILTTLDTLHLTTEQIDQTLSALFTAVDKGNWYLKSSVIMALGKLSKNPEHVDQVVPVLLKNSENDDPDVRSSAIMALSALNYTSEQLEKVWMVLLLATRSLTGLGTSYKESHENIYSESARKAARKALHKFNFTTEQVINVLSALLVANKRATTKYDRYGITYSDTLLALAKSRLLHEGGDEDEDEDEKQLQNEECAAGDTVEEEDKLLVLPGDSAILTSDSVSTDSVLLPIPVESTIVNPASLEAHNQEEPLPLRLLEEEAVVEVEETLPIMSLEKEEVKELLPRMELRPYIEAEAEAEAEADGDEPLAYAIRLARPITLLNHCWDISNGVSVVLKKLSFKYEQIDQVLPMLSIAATGGDKIALEALNKVHFMQEQERLDSTVNTEESHISQGMVFSALIQATKDKNPNMRKFVYQVLAEFLLFPEQIGIVMSALLEATKDEDSKVRESACIALATLECPPAQKDQVLTALLEATEDADVSESAYKTLGGLELSMEQNDRVVSALLEAIKDKNSDARKSAFEILGNLQCSSAQKDQVLSVLLEAIKDEEVRQVAYKALSGFECSMIQKAQVISALLETAKDQDKYVRRDAYETLGMLECLPEQKDQILLALLEATKDEDADIRKCACTALGVFDCSPEQKNKVLPDLLQATKDEDKYVSQSAYKALSRFELSFEQKDKILITLLEATKNEDVGGYACTALRALEFSLAQKEKLFLTLLGIIKDKDSVQFAYKALGRLKYSPEQKDKVFPILLEASQGQNKYWEVRQNACIDLMALELSLEQKDQVFTAMLKYIKDNSGNVVESAHEALRKLELSLEQKDKLFLALLEAIKHRYQIVIESAYKTLTELELSPEQNNRVFPALFEASKDEHYEVREFAYKALGGLKCSCEQKEQVLSTLLEGTKDEEVRLYAYKALAILECSLEQKEQVLSTLLEGTKDEEVRLYAYKALGILECSLEQKDQVLSALLEATKDEDKYVRESIYEILGSFQCSPEQKGQVLSTLLEGTKDEEVRLYAYKALGVLECSLEQKNQVLSALLEATKDEDKYVRKSIYEILGSFQCSPEQKGQVLSVLLEATKDEEVRRNVCIVLGVFECLLEQKDQVLSALLEATKDEDRDVRLVAYEVLGKFQCSLEQKDQILSALFEATKDKDIDLRKSIYDILGRFKFFPEQKGRVLPILIEAIKKNKYGDIGQAVYKVLDKLQCLPADKVLSDLLAATQDKDAGVKQTAYKALGALKFSPEQNDKVFPVLLKAIKDEDSHVRQYVWTALSKLELSPEQTGWVLPALLEAINDQYGYVVQSACTALSELTFSPEQKDQVLTALLGTIPPLLFETTKCGAIQAVSVFELLPEQKEKIVPVLLDASKDKEWEVRELAYRVLGELECLPEQTGSVLSVLLEATKDTDCRIRESAYIALTKVKLSPEQKTPVLSALLETIKDENESIRHDTCVALGGCEWSLEQKDQVLSALLEATKDADQYVRHATCAALGSCKWSLEQTERVLSALLVTITDEERDVRQSAYKALSELEFSSEQKDKIFPILLGDIKDEENGQFACKALATLTFSPEQKNKVLKRLLIASRSIDPQLKAAAKEALASLYGQSDNSAKQLSALEQALKIKKVTYGAQHIEYAQTLVLLSKYYVNIGSIETSISYINKALAIIKKEYGKKHTLYKDCLQQHQQAQEKLAIICAGIGGSATMFLRARRNKVEIAVGVEGEIDLVSLDKSTRNIPSQPDATATTQLRVSAIGAVARGFFSSSGTVAVVETRTDRVEPVAMASGPY